jgi:hypothetical protein
MLITDGNQLLVIERLVLVSLVTRVAVAKQKHVYSSPTDISLLQNLHRLNFERQCFVGQSILKIDKKDVKGKNRCDRV